MSARQPERRSRVELLEEALVDLGRLERLAEARGDAARVREVRELAVEYRAALGRSRGEASAEEQPSG